MTLRRDPITGDLRLYAPGRAERPTDPGSERGCPFCAGHEAATPSETGRIDDPHGSWRARSFPNRFPLTDPHEVLVPTPRHVERWRDLTLPELTSGLELLRARRDDLRGGGGYVHAFANDGAQAGASLRHVHAQLVRVPPDRHAARLTDGVLEGDCALCAVLRDADATHVVERGRHAAIIAHPLPRLAGGLLLVPLDHTAELQHETLVEVAALLHRALQAVSPDLAVNLWIVAEPQLGSHWYLEVQPRSANLAGVELALGLNVVAGDPVETAASARERLAMTPGS